MCYDEEAYLINSLLIRVHAVQLELGALKLGSNMGNTYAPGH
jgi:hypothetical protein